MLIGEDGTLKLADFGCSKRFHSFVASCHLISLALFLLVTISSRDAPYLPPLRVSVRMGDAGSTMAGAASTLSGTPYFMAPEVIRQSGAGRSSDLWATGGTVIEVRAPGSTTLHGSKPYWH